MKLLKIYRTLRKLEKRKYNGGHFAPEIRTVIQYFSAKHLLNKNDDKASCYSENASRASSAQVRKSQD